ncbi:hypothetical protein F383_34573 [Gossypium arboreum]|nr:hypothetical protein F383_34573 [Gossypium arboreum]
MDSWTN